MNELKHFGDDPRDTMEDGQAVRYWGEESYFPQKRCTELCC